MTIGENIKRLRKEKGIKQIDLANYVGVNAVTMRGYENGKYKPKYDKLKLIAACLGVSPSDIDENLKKINSLEILRPGDKIKRIRQKKGITLEELAQNTNMKIDQLLRYESNHTTPQKQQLERIANALSIDISEIKGTTHVFHLPSLDFSNTMPFPGIKEPYATGKMFFDNDDTRKNTIVIDTDIDQKHPYNIIMKKQQEGIELTLKEKEYLTQYIASFDLSKPFRKISDVIKRLEDSISDNYELLNEAGQKKADEEIDRTAKQIELLTKIPEYRKEEN